MGVMCFSSNILRLERKALSPFKVSLWLLMAMILSILVAFPLQGLMPYSCAHEPITPLVKFFWRIVSCQPLPLNLLSLLIANVLRWICWAWQLNAHFEAVYFGLLGAHSCLNGTPPRGYARILTLKADEYELIYNKGCYGLSIKCPLHAHVPQEKINLPAKKEIFLLSFSIDKTKPEIRG